VKVLVYGSGVWGLGFEVWGCGVWGLGFAIFYLEIVLEKS